MQKTKTNKPINEKNSKKEIMVSAGLLPAIYFGYKLTTPISVTAEDIKLAKSIYKEKGFLHDNLFPLEELISVLRSYKELDGDSTSPALYAYEGIPNGPHTKHRKKAGESQISLHIIGVETSIAEALAIKTTETILNESGYKKTNFKINQIGGKTAQAKFHREATAYFRKYITSLTPDDRQLFKKGVYFLLTQSKNLAEDLFQTSPKTVDFLGDDTRKNLSETLEFLESFGTTYEMNDFVLGDPNYSSHTIFEVTDEQTNKVLAYGTRYNLLAKKIGLRKDIAAISVLINAKQTKNVSPKLLKKALEPNLFLIQVGSTAKIKSLKVIDMLRKAEIGIKHTVYRDRLSSQILLSKKWKHDYALIIGHKEALEDSVIVRDSQGRAQKTVKIDDLIEHLKTLK